MTDCQIGRVRLLYGQKGGRYPFNHSLYLQGDKARVVIDPACCPEKLARLQGEGVDQVWLSHWHEDHIHYLGLFESCPMRISERDFPPLTDLSIFIDWYGILSDSQRAYWEKVMLEDFAFQPREDAWFLEDNAVVDLGGLSVQVIPTPGHTPGHLSFFIPEEELLFVGDYDLASFGPWYGDVLSSIEDTIASIHKLKAIPARRWVTAHNTGLYEENPGPLWTAYENVIYERERKLLAVLDRPCTLEEICAAWVIYGRPREPKQFYEFNEKVMIGKHLEYLLKRGKIILKDKTYEKVTQ